MLGCVLLMSSCTLNNDKDLMFKIPQVINSQQLDTNDIYKPRTMFNGEFPVELGPFDFNKSQIDLKLDSTSRINPYIDHTTVDNEWLNEKLKNRRFQIIPDYEQTLYYRYKKDVTTMYPVFVVNTQDEDQVIETHSTYSCASEYYFDEKLKTWISIESIGTSSFPFCGCCTSFYYVRSKQYIVLLFPKYDTGQLYNFKIKMNRINAESESFRAYLDTTLFHPIDTHISSDGVQRVFTKHDTNQAPLHY